MTLIVLFVGLSIAAQEYIPILKEGSFWVMKESWLSGNVVCSEYSKVQVDGDTVINGVTYKKLKSAPLRDQNGETYCIEPPLFLDESEFTPITTYFLREDVDEKRLYIYTEYPSETWGEFTVCDFSLEVGDQMVNYFAPIDGIDLFVETIQTTSDNRTQYIMDDGSAYTEGIGKVEGNSQIYLSTVHGISYEVACHGNDEGADSCTGVLSTTSELLPEIKIYPNPTSDKIYFTNLENNSFKLYSILGKEMSFQFSAENQSLDISHLRNGVYILEVWGENNKKRVLKFIKN